MKILIPAFLSLILFFHSYSQDQHQLINDNMPDKEIDKIMAAAQNNYSRIKEIKTTIGSSGFSQTEAHVLFSWPLTSNAEYDGIPNYYFIQNYVDNDPGPGIIEYNCGQRTYNGHNGTDISLWPFWWNMKEKDYVVVIAAAAGIVIQLDLYNQNDNNCSCGTNGNNIAILHADSTVSLYFHMKTGSQMVREGDIVYEGQPMALVASSGCSSNPHLHFEIRDKNKNVIDPWIGTNPSGDCNNRSETSWWKSQKPYWEPQINRIMTHSEIPELTGFNGMTGSCPINERMSPKNSFIPGETVFIGFAVHDYLANTSVPYQIIFPTGAIVSGTHTNSFSQNQVGYYFVANLLLPNNAPPGTYTVVANYQGVNYYHYFSVNCVSNYTLTGSLSGPRGFIASNNIQSSSVVATGSDIRFQAANSIVFNPGFTATAGAILKARIKDCNYTE